MSTATETATDAVADAIGALEDAAGQPAKKSHKLLKLIIVLGIIGAIFAVVKQLTSDSEPESYEPVSSGSGGSRPS